MNERELEKKLEIANKNVKQLLTIMEAQQDMIAQNFAKINKLEQMVAKSKRDLENLTCNLRYEMGDNKEFEARYWYPKIMDQQLTLKQLIDQKKSFFRFTETELNILLHLDQQEEADQQEDKKMQEIREKLKDILYNESDKYLIALPNFFGSLDYYKMPSRKIFRDYLTERRRRGLMELLPQHKNYHDAMMMHPNEYDPVKSGILTLERYQKLEPLWEGKKIVAISIPSYALAKENPYFKNASSFVNIEISTAEAYRQQEQILEKCMNENDGNAICLLGAGPIGIIQGAEICKQGMQVIDVGSLGKHYMEFRARSGGKKHVSP